MKLPLITVSVVLSAAAVACSGPHVASVLVFDRSRILSGELWRLVTCNWVHFSKTHLAYDLLAFAFAGSLIEHRGLRGFGTFCLLSPALIGVTVFLTRPDLQMFGGLSGLAIGASVLLCLRGVRERTTWRWICLLGLLALAAKTTFEFTTGQPLFARAEAISIIAVPESHIAGAVIALLVWYFYIDPRDATPKNRLPEKFGRINNNIRAA